MAGLTVLVSLFGLGLSTLPVYTSFGYATFATVGAVMLAAVTLVPALCGLAGRRILPRRVRRERPVKAGPTRTERWARRVTARPVRSVVLSVVALGALAAPALAMRTWPQDAGSQPESNTTRRAYDLVAAEYGPGANGTMLLAVDLDRVPDAAAVAGTVRGVPGVASVGQPIPNAAGDTAVIVVQPTRAPSDEGTTDLVRRVRDTVPDGVYTTGVLPTFSDISVRLDERLWIVIGFVVALSVLLLTVLLRAPVVALKAAVMNLALGGRGVRRDHRDLPDRHGRTAGRPAARRDGVHLGADPDVRRPLRTVDGLRGVPALAGA